MDLDQPTPFLSAVAELLRRIEETIPAAYQHSIEVILVGGVAVHVWTNVRTSADAKAVFSHRMIFPRQRFGDPERWPPATALATGRRPIPADPAGDDLARRWRMGDGVHSARFESERGLHPLAVAAAAQRLAADHPSHIGP